MKKRQDKIRKDRGEESEGQNDRNGYGKKRIRREQKGKRTRERVRGGTENEKKNKIAV